jgi:hypothetical protein
MAYYEPDLKQTEDMAKKEKGKKADGVLPLCFAKM